MTNQSVADRLVNYGDAIAAFSAVNTLALLVAMGENEVRCSLADQALLVYSGMVSFAVVLTLAVVWCHRTEGRLRAEAGGVPEHLRRLRLIFFVVRLVVIWLFNVGALPLARIAMGDPACLVSAA